MGRHRLHFVLTFVVISPSLASSSAHAQADLPVATDEPAAQQQQQQQQQPPQQPQQPPSAPIATELPRPAPPPPNNNDFRSSAAIAFVNFGIAPIVSRTTAVSGTDGGVLAGVRGYIGGIDDALSFRVDVEGRLGGGSDGFLTRDRGTFLFGGAARLGQFGALTLRGGADARYVRSSNVEYGRILVPAIEVGLYRFGARGSGSPHIDLAALGGLAAYTSLRADNNIAFDRALAAGGGGSLTVGARYVAARVSYLRTLGAEWASDLDAALCVGQYIAACLEIDHVIVDPQPTGNFTTWRAVLALGLGVAWAE